MLKGVGLDLPRRKRQPMKPLFKDNNWTFSKIEEVLKVIEDIAKNEYGLDYYTPQVEVISAAQMLRCYCSNAMPIMYDHWSFGKKYLELMRQYKSGLANLAYEVVINTDPCIAYLVETNSMLMQTLVLAHASIGHSSFFKNNYLFQEHTNSKSIISYLKYAKDYISKCRKLYGTDVVENLITDCHVLQYHSIDKYQRRHKTKAKLKAQKEARADYKQQSFDPLMDFEKRKKKSKAPLKGKVPLPEDNLLYFVEKATPHLEDWKREVIRIIRKVSQYFYPQGMTKMNNEAYASFWHYSILNNMADKGLLTEGQRLEFLRSHTNVTTQTPYYSKYYHGLNPYTLGFKIYQDIKRLCENPTKEDELHHGHLIGKDWVEVVKEMAAGNSDTSLVANYLTPKVAKDLRLFSISKIENDEGYEQQFLVESTHSQDTFHHLRRSLARTYEWGYTTPHIEIVYVNWLDRVMKIRAAEVDNKSDVSGVLTRLTNCSIMFV